ncbi:TPA: hypothetical protein N0F65_006850 [Lagenidium giganteum]|uniref:SET domain-containing protein n=1 Tax=Lagenidium giganteum TaxID=4803 RepID=A0AAV2Z8E9_9STRA|nr:TPA: hypothetical protein N0F65_006850 [Lagenidium giganteum]
MAALRRVRDAVRRTRGCFVSPAIEAHAFPRMGTGIRATERIPQDTLVFQASADLWRPFSADFALEQAQLKAPGFVQQLQQLVRSSAQLQQSPFVANALVLGVHLVVNAPPPGAQATMAALTDPQASLQDLYVHALPDFVELPLYWHEGQLRELQACHAVRRAVEHSRRFYLQVHEHLFGANNTMVPRQEFFWALSILLSRATSGQQQPFTLIPFFDWFNHGDNGDECAHTFDEQKGFQVVTTKSYEPGEQLLINYGHLPNARLLRNYGFATAENAHDLVQVPLPPTLQALQPQDPASPAKARLLDALGVRRAPPSVTIDANGDVAADHRRWLHVIMATQQELDSIMQASSAASPVIPLSLEQRVDAHVRDLARAHLSSFGTTCEADRKFLEDNNDQMAPWLRACLNCRVSEKTVLERAIHRLQK